MSTALHVIDCRPDLYESLKHAEPSGKGKRAGLALVIATALAVAFFLFV